MAPEESDSFGGPGFAVGDPALPACFVPVADLSDLDLAWLRSFAGPVVLFNFDPG